MALRSTSETIQDLRQLLKDLESPKGSDCDPVALNDLKHLVLNRLAELEAAAARELRDREAADYTSGHGHAA
jgi:hypothetical protein